MRQKSSITFLTVGHWALGVNFFATIYAARRNSILLTDFDRRLRSILLTSASPSEGKSTVAAHLAATHAGQGKRTLLIDGDLRRPSVHRLYQIPNSVGLSNVLLQQISWRDALVRMPEPAVLDILPAGPSTRRASDLIAFLTNGVQPSITAFGPSAIRLHRHRLNVSVCVTIRPSRKVNRASMRLCTLRPVTENV